LTGADIRALPILIFAASILMVQGSSAQAASADDGHDLVQRNCAMCHAVGRADASPNPAAPAFPNLHLFFPVDNLAKPLAEGRLAGHPPIPAFKFSPGQITDIIMYLHSIQTQ
jgi:cytochrome c